MEISMTGNEADSKAVDKGVQMDTTVVGVEATNKPSPEVGKAVENKVGFPVISFISSTYLEELTLGRYD
jgi:hypothetical protein